MSATVKQSMTKISKFSGIVLFIFLMFFNVQFALNNSQQNHNSINILGLEIKLNETKAAIEAQNFKLSVGVGHCVCGSGDYWASCHLYGSECSITPCTCFWLPD